MVFYFPCLRKQEQYSLAGNSETGEALERGEWVDGGKRQERPGTAQRTDSESVGRAGHIVGSHMIWPAFLPGNVRNAKYGKYCTGPYGTGIGEKYGKYIWLCAGKHK